MYTFKENIRESDFTSFVKTSSFAPIQQTKAWTELKNSWQHFYCGIYDDKNLVGAAMILIRKLMPGFSCAYCPRGPILDFTDKQAVEAFACGAEDFCRRHGVYALTVDPELTAALTLPDLEKQDYFNTYDLDKSRIGFDNLIEAGFIHKGFGKELHSTLQPRYNAMIPLCDAEETPLTPEQIKKNYRAKIRKYFGSFQTSRGLFFEKAEPTDENLNLFESIIRSTEQRQNISLRGESYFRLLADGFKDDACFAFEKCDVSKYIEGLRARLEKEPQNAEKINQQLEEAERIKADKGDIITLAALLTVYPPNETGVKVAEYLYAGSDLSAFPAFRATLCGLYEQCILCVEKGCHYLNLGGFAGTFDDGLFEFKNQFNPLCVEYAGEFDLVVKPGKQKFMTKYLPALRRIYKKLRPSK